MHWFILLYLRWLKATNAYIAIRKYLIDRTPFLKGEKHQFLWIYYKWSNNHNIVTTESPQRISLRLRILIKSCD